MNQKVVAPYIRAMVNAQRVEREEEFQSAPRRKRRAEALRAGVMWFVVFAFLLWFFGGFK
jgi:hypothetical protein